MKIEFYPEEKLKKEIMEILGRHLDLSQYQVFFFGSRVNGRANERSDIDVGIKGPKPISFKIIAEIEDEIDNLAILYKIEIVDFSRLPEKFRQVANQNIEMINK